ncbi:MAG TPA: NTP transferase domain-containing protein, partial [Steroidobacteraceae bacterium]|nr:NTP transferase domain-containing protein [Steroidobacteraceae bacterium]
MGRPKALLPHARAGTFAGHVVAQALHVASEVYMLGIPPLLPASLRRLPWIPDSSENSGPLAGLCSLLTIASDRWALLLACDLPLLGVSALHQLIAHTGQEVDAVAFANSSRIIGASREALRWHACCALYHPRILHTVKRELVTGRRSLQQVLRSIRLVTLFSQP